MTIPFKPEREKAGRIRSLSKFRSGSLLCAAMLGFVLAPATTADPASAFEEAILDLDPAGGASTWSDPFPLPIRNVRVIIVDGADLVRLRSSANFRLTKPAGAEVARFDAEIDLHLRPDSSGRIRAGESTIDSTRIHVVPEAGAVTSVSAQHGGEWSPERRFRGSFTLLVSAAESLNVVNEIGVEDYVAGVVAWEIWPTFDTEVYRVQAILARTYVLYQMLQASTSSWDVAATQGSQVYRGVRDDSTGRRAVEAAEFTRGIVLTWNNGRADRIFCAYYSAACGGRSQDASIFGPESAIPPLAGNVSCDYCKIAPAQNYRWGPVRIRKRELLDRLGARHSEWLSANDLAFIEATEKGPDGRTVRLRVSGGGLTREYLAERFRMLVGGSVMKSTHCDIRLEGDQVVVENGRGFGHGLGLCQWGAQGQARQGRSASDILRYYFPGAKLLRAY